MTEQPNRFITDAPGRPYRYQFAEPERARESVAFIPRTPGQLARSRRILDQLAAWYTPKPTRWQRIKRALRRWLP